MKFIEWIRIVPDLTFMLAGVIPLLIAAFLTYLAVARTPVKTATKA